jgi:hypothetical protein
MRRAMWCDRVVHGQVQTPQRGHASAHNAPDVAGAPVLGRQLIRGDLRVQHLLEVGPHQLDLHVSVNVNVNVNVNVYSLGCDWGTEGGSSQHLGMHEYGQGTPTQQARALPPLPW